MHLSFSTYQPLLQDDPKSDDGNGSPSHGRMNPDSRKGSICVFLQVLQQLESPLPQAQPADMLQVDVRHMAVVAALHMAVVAALHMSAAVALVLGLGQQRTALHLSFSTYQPLLQDDPKSDDGNGSPSHGRMNPDSRRGSICVFLQVLQQLESPLPQQPADMLQVDVPHMQGGAAEIVAGIVVLHMAAAVVVPHMAAVVAARHMVEAVLVLHTAASVVASSLVAASASLVAASACPFPSHQVLAPSSCDQPRHLDARPEGDGIHRSLCHMNLCSGR